MWIGNLKPSNLKYDDPKVTRRVSEGVVTVRLRVRIGLVRGTPRSPESGKSAVPGECGYQVVEPPGRSSCPI